MPMMIDWARPCTVADQRQAAAARARAVGGGGQIADRVADQRDAEVGEVGDHHLADLAGLRRPAVAHDLDDVRLGVDVVAVVRLALVRDAAELAAAVLVEHLGLKRLLDGLAALRRQRLRRRDDPLRPDAVDVVAA